MVFYACINLTTLAASPDLVANPYIRWPPPAANFIHLNFTVIMNNKVTLPPISDIFANKESARSLPDPHHHPYPAGYPAMPLYSYQYVNTATAAANQGLPPLYPSAAPPSYSLYTPTFAGRPPAVTGGRYGAPGLPVPIGGTPVSGRPLVSSTSRRSSLQLPTSPRASSLDLELASPEALGMLQTLRSRTRNNLPKETTYILLKWLNDHLNHPYPNSFEKTQLMMTTGLNQQQLSNWFINARRRKIKVLRQKQKLASN